jgi:phosphocarrier protein
MVKTSIVIENETGLHARPATEIAKIAMKYPCEILFKVDEKNINAKSPLMIMSAGIKSKTKIEILCEGEEEEKALEELKKAFENQNII